MSLLTITSPHTTDCHDTARMMQWVCIATLPGVVALTFSFGWGTLTNIAIAIVSALLLEALAVRLRKRPVRFYLTDYSAVVTALLLGTALPPYSAWWVILTGIFFSIVIAKHLYGGMGYNPFNPAMVGYIVLLISFPVEMTRWAAPLDYSPVAAPTVLQSFSIALQTTAYPSIDGFTAATPLDLVRQNNALTISELKDQYNQFGYWGGLGWELANLGFLCGGLLLLYKKIYSWHAPVSMLVSLFVFSSLFYDGGSANSIGSPLFQLFSGATMLGAWFIVTDPVSSAVSTRGRIIFGACVGALIFIIRKWGNYPDAVAFAVLLMNFSAPLMDHYTQPRTYGK